MVTRPHRPIGSLALFGVLLIAAIVVGIAMATHTFRDRELANSERELKNTALILAEQTDRTIQSLDLVLTSVIERVPLVFLRPRISRAECPVRMCSPC